MAFALSGGSANNRTTLFMWIALNRHFRPREKLLINVELGIDVPEDCVSTPRGSFSCLDNHIVGLFAVDWQLYVYIDGRATWVMGDNVRAEHHKLDDRSEITLRVDSRRYRMTYRPPEPVDSLIGIPETEEDVDFGLRLSNILNSEKDRTHFIERCTNHT
jgi:hypothetical protein